MPFERDLTPLPKAAITTRGAVRLRAARRDLWSLFRTFFVSLPAKWTKTLLPRKAATLTKSMSALTKFGWGKNRCFETSSNDDVVGYGAKITVRVDGLHSIARFDRLDSARTGV